MADQHGSGPAQARRPAAGRRHAAAAAARAPAHRAAPRARCPASRRPRRATARSAAIARACTARRGPAGPRVARRAPAELHHVQGALSPARRPAPPDEPAGPRIAAPRLHSRPLPPHPPDPGVAVVALIMTRHRERRSLLLIPLVLVGSHRPARSPLALLVSCCCSSSRSLRAGAHGATTATSARWRWASALRANGRRGVRLGSPRGRLKTSSSVSCRASPSGSLAVDWLWPLWEARTARCTT